MRRSPAAQTPVRPALVEAAVYDEDVLLWRGRLALKPVDDVHASSLVVLDKGTQQQSLVELGREYAVTCRKERRAAPVPAFHGHGGSIESAATGRGVEARDQRAADEVRERRYYSKGPLRRGKRPGRPATLASVSINDDDMGPARGTKDVEAADATLSTSCSLRGWASCRPTPFRWTDPRPSSWKWCPR